MPSSVTHSYFSVDVYNRIDKNIKNKLKNNIEDLKTFSQGPDPYFFYDFHLTKRSKEIYKINYSMHHKKINDYFLSLINYINDKKYYSNGQVMAYLYGHICHFVLDSNADIAILPIWDICGFKKEARINFPGTISDENWTWKLKDYKGFEQEMMKTREWIVSSNRENQQ